MNSRKREYRSLTEFRVLEEEQNPYIVTGYAATFDPYVLLTIDGVQYSERIMSDAFDAADLSDVIFQFDHRGRVYARRSNGTLDLSADGHGLRIQADLSSTEAAKAIFEEIRTGLITKMSFGFVVDSDHYEAATHTRVIDRVAKVYDVSAVSLPANNGTEIGISMRGYFDGIREAERQQTARLATLELQRRRVNARLRLTN